jgi:hypothetical protein
MLIAFLIAGSMWAGTPALANETGRQYLREVMLLEAEITATNAPSKGQVFERSYQMETTTWDNERLHTKVKCYQAAAAIHFLSDEISMYMDESDVFLVHHEAKSIFYSESAPNAFNGAPDQMIAIRKAFLENAEILSAKTLADGRKYLKLGKSAVQLPGMQIESMEYVFIPDEELVSVKVNYAKSYKVKSMVMTDAVFDIKCKRNMKKPVRDLILDGNNKVRSAFSGYTFIDNNH